MTDVYDVYVTLKWEAREVGRRIETADDVAHEIGILLRDVQPAYYVSVKAEPAEND